jgi:hypothetical protein
MNLLSTNPKPKSATLLYPAPARAKPPRWWTAYNNVKHHDVQRHTEGNLENALTSVASLAVLKLILCWNISTILFANIGIIYPEGDPSISVQSRIFP